MRQKSSPGIQEGRGKNAVARLLSEKLIVPKIFIEAQWPNSRSRIDVLAVDRSGAGDLHVVEISSDASLARSAIHKLLLSVPAQYKYVAMFDTDPFFDFERDPDAELYAQDGIGRVGLISLYEPDPGAALSAEIVVEPERFRVPAELHEDLDRFVAKHHPDIAVRV